jgi:hypothetical protein
MLLGVMLLLLLCLLLVALLKLPWHELLLLLGRAQELQRGKGIVQLCTYKRCCQQHPHT